MEKINIKLINDNRLCTGCGTCVVACPKSAIKMVKDKSNGIYSPHVDDEKCENCGICHKVCAGQSVNFNGLNESLFGKIPEDIYLGSYINCYVGHDTDHAIRYNSASGGLVTGLLIFALEKGLINGALLTRMNKKKALEPEPFIARTKEEIISASGSKYCPVPTNIALKKIINEDGRFAVVGLPCHIQGIRKLQMLEKKLINKLVLFGIFCGGVKNFLATELLIQKLGIKEGDIKKLNYRGCGWPGSMSVELNNGDTKFIPLKEYYKGEFVAFTPNRCFLCIDGLSELADISFGDAWLPEYDEDKIGMSIAITRSSIGEEIMKNAAAGKRVKVNKIDREKVLQSQKRLLLSKKERAKAYFFLFKLFGNKVPIYDRSLFKSNIKDYFIAALYILRTYISSKPQLRFLLKIYPFLLHRKNRPNQIKWPSQNQDDQ